MAQYEISAPDGSKYQVTAPDGASDNDVLSYAQSQWKPQTDLKKNLAESTSSGEAYKIGAGRMADRLWEGLKQSGAGIGAIFSELLPDRLKRAAQEEITKHLEAQSKLQTFRSAEYEPLKEAHPIATTLGEATTLAATPQMRLMEGAGLGAQAVNMGASSALGAASEYGTAEERGQRAALAGIGGAVAPGITKAITAVGGKVLSPILNRLTPEQQRLAAEAEKQGIDLTAGQKTGNKFLQTVESVMEGMPATSGTQTGIKQGQREAFTKNIMARLGEASGEATPATVAAAKSRVGQDFERIFGKVDVPLDNPQTQAQLGAIIKDASATLPGDTSKVVANRIYQLIDKVNEDGAVPGKAYQAWRSQVQKQAEGTQDAWLREQLRNVYRAVDQVAYQAADKVGEAGNLAAARGKYRDLLTISPLVDKSTDGMISPALLLGAANRSGTEELKTAGRVGKAFVADQIPNSFTANRGLAQALMSGGSGLAVGGGTYAATGDPMMALKAGGGALASSVVAPKLIQSLINSGGGQKYLSEGFRRPLSPLEQALMDRSARLTMLASGREFSE